MKAVELLFVIVYASQKGNTPLHTASLAGKVDVARILIDAGSNVNAQSQVIYCTLHNFHLFIITALYSSQFENLTTIPFQLAG